MAAYRGEAVASFNQTVGVKQDMDEAIRILSPSDTPLQQLLPTVSTNEIKVEWMEEELMPQAVTNTAVSGTGPWTLTTSATDPAFGTSELRVGDVLGTRDGTTSAVQWVVSSITNSTTYVVAAFPTGAHTTGPTGTSTLEIIGQYIVEGADPLAPRSTERVGKFNYTQISQEAVQATRTARNRGMRNGMFGLDNEDPYTHELGKKFKELAVRFERSMIHGQRAISSDSKQRFMGGLFYYITTNSISGLKANIKTLLNDAIRKAYDAGSSPEVLMVSPTVKSIISTLNDSYLNINRGDVGAGTKIDTFMSDFGELRVIANRHFPKTRGVVLCTSQNDHAIVNFDPYTHELLAKTGDADKGQIVAEKSLKVKNEKGAVLFTVTDA